MSKRHHCLVLDRSPDKSPWEYLLVEPKSSGKDVNGSASKSNAPPKGTPLPSSNAGSSNAASGPVTEQEIRAVLMQRTPLTTQELVAKFKGRLRCAEVSSNFA
ncbi:transcription initiation factor IIF subunit alpha-like protein [Trifolium pratense]|uniref:Transcription initiation factor IIF subunit alpha n=1 Tax=Trifolium pratense TaxID=57577 RepID=A0A2K3M1N0_TRIPR|nr:transcription initiation factor IIF subunit alpha-like protein [Trifolium pratense]